MINGSFFSLEKRNSYYYIRMPLRRKDSKLSPLCIKLLLIRVADIEMLMKNANAIP